MHCPNRKLCDEAGRGWITPAVGWLLYRLTRPSDRLLGSRLFAQTMREDGQWLRRNAIKIDTYVASCLLLECALYIFFMHSTGNRDAWRMIGLTGVFLRMADLLATAIRIPLFDSDRVVGKYPHAVLSTERVIVLGFINYIELAVCFACVYAFWSGSINSGGAGLGWLDPFYLSCSTQLTIGFGDVSPTHGLRIASCIQGFASLGLVTLLIGRFIASLRPVPDLDDIERSGGLESHRSGRED